VRYPTFSHHFLSKASNFSYNLIHTSSPSELLQTRGSYVWIACIPYLGLLQRYIEDLLIKQEESSQQTGNKELFFFLMIESWINCELVLTKDHHNFPIYQQLFAGDLVGKSGQELLSPNHNNHRYPVHSHSYDTTTTTTGQSSSSSSSTIGGGGQYPHPCDPMILHCSTAPWTIGSCQVSLLERSIVDVTLHLLSHILYMYRVPMC
jgi:hypothetical protein